jgi:hypothetical protein
VPASPTMPEPEPELDPAAPLELPEPFDEPLELPAPLDEPLEPVEPLDEPLEPPVPLDDPLPPAPLEDPVEPPAALDEPVEPPDPLEPVEPLEGALPEDPPLPLPLGEPGPASVSPKPPFEGEPLLHAATSDVANAQRAHGRRNMATTYPSLRSPNPNLMHHDEGSIPGILAPTCSAFRIWARGAVDER